MGNISSAVEKRATEPAPVSLASAARDRVTGAIPRFQLVMPDNVDEARFGNLVVGAVMREPKLIKCFATKEGEASLIVAAIQCASLGLEPNTPLKEAALVPRKNKGRDECQLMVEYRGLIKLARRSGEIQTISAEVVHARDEFEYQLGDQPFLRHKPYDGDEDPGELTHCYCVVKMTGGGSQFVVVPRRVVHKDHRSKSDSWRNESSRPYSPWTTFEESMWRKTAVRCIEPFLPLTSEFRQALDSDERTFAADGDRIVPVGISAYSDDDLIDVTALDVDCVTGELVDPAVA